MLSRGIDMTGPIKPENLGMFQSYFPNYRIIPRPGIDNAYVEANTPNIVYADPALNYAGTFPHEFEHQLDFKARQRYGMPQRPDLTFWKQATEKVGLDPFKTITKFGSNIKNSVSNINKLYKEKTGEELPEFSRLWSADKQDLEEILAELSAVESVLKMDFTKDKNLRKQIFNDDEKLAQVYRSLTSGRQDRLDAKDLAPYTVQQQELSPWDRVVNILKNSLD